MKEVDKGTALLKLYNFTDDAIVFPFQSPSDASEMVDDPELRQGKKSQNWQLFQLITYAEDLKQSQSKIAAEILQ